MAVVASSSESVHDPGVGAADPYNRGGRVALVPPAWLAPLSHSGRTDVAWGLIPFLKRS